MDQNQMHQEIAMIKSMIEKTKKETAESGSFFIAMGLFAMAATFVISRFDSLNLNHLVLPALFIMLILSGIIGYITVGRKEKNDQVKSYAKTVCYSIWFACSIPIIMTMFIFPLLEVYSWNLTPILTTLMIGIAVFSSGVIFESKPVIACSFVWWGGALAMAFVYDSPRAYIMMAILFLGWVLPGFILNRQYKNRSRKNGS
jgi:hypothetical protein